MLSLIAHLAWLIVLAPLLAALWIGFSFMVGWNRGEEGESGTARVAIGAISTSTLLLLLFSVLYLFGIRFDTLEGMTWINSGIIHIELALLLDGLSLSIATALSIVLLLVVRFSVNYLHREAAFQRFFMMLMLLCLGMELIWLSGNAALTFVGWELAGVSSYLLIAYNWKRPTATLNAQRAFITNRIGDAGFILALFAALYFFNTLDWQALALQVPAMKLNSLPLSLLTVGLLIAALAKSAQLPFSSWITHALEGPTPSSAVYYGSVMVHAGVYLLLRAAPLMETTPALSYLIGLVGLLTVLYAWLSAQVQTDIKSSLIFATLMQVGLMLIEIALGWYTLATIHLILHAWWRAYQFLHAPSFMQLTHYPAPPTPRWLTHKTFLRNAALQRFWLDSLTHALLVKPTQALSKDAQVLEDHVIDRLTGTPFAHQPAIGENDNVTLRAGIPGQFLAQLARGAEWMEAYLTTEVGSSSFLKKILYIERYLEIIERLLRQPHYLIVLITISLVIVL
ncbi:MAG: hypothetical protein IPL34_03400 [Thiofilum sp.]|nr:hypothetical protein [Thiofilum sp.]